MHALLCAFLFFCALFCTTLVIAQESCVDPCDIPDLGLCKSITYPLYPIGLNVTTTNAFLAPNFELFRSVSGPFPECALALESLTCATAYPSCTSDGTNVQPVLPCIDLCLLVNQTCQPIFSFLNSTQLAALDCNATLIDGSPAYSFDPNSCANISTMDPNPDCPQYANNDTTNSTNTNTNTNPYGGCQKYDPSIAHLSATMCAAYVADEIFVPSPDEPYVQAFLDQQIASNVSLLLKFYPMLPIKCYKMIASMLCQVAFPTCIHVNDSYEDASPHCDSYCEETTDVCRDIFQLMGPQYTSAFNCSQSNPLTGAPLFPSTNCNVVVFPPQTRNMGNYSTLPPFECPKIMGRKKHPTENDAQCAYPCPDYTFTPHQRKILVYTMFILSAVSLGCVAILGFSQVLVAEKRLFPANFTIWMNLVVGFMTLSYLASGLTPEDDVWCVDRGTYSTQSNNTRCAAQAFIFLYFGMVANGILFSLAATAFIVIVLGKRTHWVANQNTKFHVFIWGFPAIFVIALLAKGLLGFMPFLPLCFIVVMDFGHFDTKDIGFTLDWPLYFMPLGGVAIASMILLASTEIKILLVQKQVYSGTTRAAHRRVGTFIFFLALVVIIVLEWRFEMQPQLNSIKNIALAWFECKLKTELGLPDPGFCPGETTPTGISFGHMVLICALPCSFGIIIFLIFGFDTTNYKAWPIILNTLFKTHKYDEMWRFIRSGDTTHTWISYTPNYASSKGGFSSSGNESELSGREIELASSTTEIMHDNVNVELSTSPESVDEADTGVSTG